MRDKEIATTKGNIVLTLRYAAAALSVVSFITTMSGLKGIITNNTFLAGMISFGIQAVILVLGLLGPNAFKTIWEKTTDKSVPQSSTLLRTIVTVFMVLLYASSVGFSSFFSYVYLSNAAYREVRSTDYNTEIEMFLVENTKEIKSINQAISDVLLQEIREEAPKFSELMIDYQAKSDEEISNIINSLEKYDVNNMPEAYKFNVDDLTLSYDNRNGEKANDELIAEWQTLADNVNAYATFYDNDYYPFYTRCFDRMNALNGTEDAKNLQKEIEDKIQEMESQMQNQTNTPEYYMDTVNRYAKTCLTNMNSQYMILIGKLNEISNASIRIISNSSVADYNAMDLMHFYESIYSSNGITEDELEESINELNQIITTYIKNSETINEDDIASLSLCISYLDQLYQSKMLEEQIQQFEADQLSEVYIISTADTESDESTETSYDGFHYRELSEKEWSKVRQRDMIIFAAIVKGVPDFELILPARNEDGTRPLTDNNHINFLIAKESENYISNTLNQAYLYNREKLKNISDMERAWNYLSSENSFLAWFCFIISIFLDMVSFMIGIYMYVLEKKKEGAAENNKK